MASARESFAELLRQGLPEMSPAERRVAQVLLSDYPVSGLEPIAKLASRAHVSAPTVLRMLARIGIPSYVEMQEVLRAEISRRTASPLDNYAESPVVFADGAGGADSLVLERARELFAQEIADTFARLTAAEFESAVALLSDPKRRVWTVGGRYTGFLAEYFAMHLRMLRPGVQFIGRSESDKSLALLDLRPGDVVLAFDVRRYQKSTVRFVERAKQSRAATIVVTDPWLSPAAKNADGLLVCPVDAPSPFDSLVPALAVVETLVAGVVRELGKEPLGRIQAFDAWEE